MIHLPPAATEPVKFSELASPPPQSVHRFSALRLTRRMIVRILAYERDAPRLPIALRMLGADAPQSPAAQLWRDNGVLFAAIDQSQMPLLAANLPQPLAPGSISTLYNAHADNPITLVEGVSVRQPVNIVEADGSTRQRRFAGGEFRMLVRVSPPDEEAGPTRLALLPQHFSSRRAVVSADPRDRSREGTSFDQLFIDRPIADNEVWLITAAPADGAGDAAADRPRQESALDPVSLGEALFGGLYHGRPVRLIMLITMERWPARP